MSYNHMAGQSGVQAGVQAGYLVVLFIYYSFVIIYNKLQITDKRQISSLLSIIYSTGGVYDTR